jgi:hypothetical protein
MENKTPQNFRLLDTKQKLYCCLREYFDGLTGVWKEKIIDPQEVVEKDIVNIEKRPEFTPVIYIQKSKQLSESEYRVFSEKIYTNNPFIRNFKSFLRASSKEVKAEGFEETPEKYKDWYGTSLPLVPVNVREIGAIMKEHGELPKMIAHKEIITGIDFEDSLTLRMVKSQIIEERLKEIEGESNFSAEIVYLDSKIKGDFEDQIEIEAIEDKKGGSHYGVIKI